MTRSGRQVRERFETAHVRHGQVEHEKINVPVLNQRHRLFTVGRLTDNFKIGRCVRAPA